MKMKRCPQCGSNHVKFVPVPETDTQGAGIMVQCSNCKAHTEAVELRIVGDSEESARMIAKSRWNYNIIERTDTK